MAPGALSVLMTSMGNTSAQRFGKGIINQFSQKRKRNFQKVEGAVAGRTLTSPELTRFSVPSSRRTCRE